MGVGTNSRSSPQRLFGCVTSVDRKLQAAVKLANGVTGCLGKAGAAADCSNAGSQSSALRAAADTFIDDSLCALDPDNPGCVVPPARFVDNSDGTVTDQETGLQWEQKTGSAAGFTDCSATPCLDPHAATNAYQWCGDADHDEWCDDIFFLGFPVWPPNGGAFTDFLSALNAGSGFAGHTDWRVPTIEEFGAIRLAPFFCSTHPCIDPFRQDIHWNQAGHRLVGTHLAATIALPAS